MEGKNKEELKKAGTFVGVGAGVGLLKGGAIGIAGFGSAIGIPLVVVGAVAGLTVYGACKAYQSTKGSKQESQIKQITSK